MIKISLFFSDDIDHQLFELQFMACGNDYRGKNFLYKILDQLFYICQLLA